MSTKTNLLFLLLVCNVSVSFGQSAKHDSVETLNGATDAKDSAKVIKDNNKAHAVLNTNAGTAIPSTTTGTLNSNVNPNSQVIIPFGQKKKKSNAIAAPATPPQ